MARRFRAAIFDMDGVIVDSEPVYFRAINAALAPYGRSISEEEYRQTIGSSVTATWRRILAMTGLAADANQFLQRYDEELRRLLRSGLEPLPGVPELIRALRDTGMRVGLASSSWQAWVEALLEATGLAGQFDAVVWRQMVERAKPAPDLYLKAAETLGVHPQACLVFEDAPAGIEAAKAAGMFAVQVRAASTAFPPLPNADLAVDTLLDLDLASLLGKD